MTHKRKQYLVQKAHELFIKKGYHATSIQNLLDHSGISKGSFYNYFSSKSELLKAVLYSIHDQLDEEREAILMDEDPSDLHVFIKQVVFTMQFIRKHRLPQLIEEAVVSNEPELRALVKQWKFSFLKWVYRRFREIFPQNQKPYLFDGAIVFCGALHHFLEITNTMDEKIPLHAIISYTTDRIQSMLNEVSAKEAQLVSPKKIESCILEADHHDFLENDFSYATLQLKKKIKTVFAPNDSETYDYLKLLQFIHEEIIARKEPRVFLIKSILLSFNQCAKIQQTKEFQDFNKILSTMINKGEIQ